MMSHVRISSGLAGLPTFRKGACPSATVGAARTDRGSNDLRTHSIVHAPIALSPPRRKRIEVERRDRSCFPIVSCRCAPVFIYLLQGRLAFPSFISAAGHAHSPLAVP